MADFDVILAGGGLANTLIALALADRRPQGRVLVVEGGDHLGGDHTWCFHAADVGDAAGRLLEPMVRTAWPGQSVAFPALSRRLSTGYRAVTSATLDRHARSRLAGALRLSARISSIGSHEVVLEGGQRLTAGCVIDGRGWRPVEGLALAYQKFVGLEVETAEPHGLDVPVIMDATVPQTDGYRFMYCLPYGPTSLLLEDTYYADTATLDRTACVSFIESYARARGWTIRHVEREEAGVLPIVLAGSVSAFWPQGPVQAQSGLRSGLFHPTTGYSLPDAARLAIRIAGLPRLDHDAVVRAIHAEAQTAWQARGFYRMLNRLLFVAAQGEERQRVMQRFYGLPQALIERFYAGRSTALDKARVLSGRPPIPIARAMGALPEAAGWAFSAANGDTPGAEGGAVALGRVTGS